MKSFRVLIETYMFFMTFNSLVQGLRVSYDINFTAKCVDDKYVFQRILHTSLDQCIVECVRRSGCLSLNYQQRFTLCNLLNTHSASELGLSTTDKACIVVDKLDMQYSLPAGCKDCRIGENCDIENGICSKTECPQLELENGLLFGNMNNVGNRVKFMCNDGYKTETEEIYSTCQANGNWSIIPKCVKDHHNDITSVTTPRDCPEAWLYFKGSCYMIVSSGLNFSNAEAQCNNYGAHLARIDDESENTFINDTFCSACSLWIGLVDTGSLSRVWKWIGTEITPRLFYWAPGEPFGLSENCVIISSRGWHDVACSRLYLSLCEKEVNN